MSSTNRGYDRHKSDYYATPVEDIKSFLKEFTTGFDQIIDLDNFNFTKNLDILDPCAGDLAYSKAIKEYGFPDYNDIKTLDIRGDSLADIKADYLSWTPDKQYDLIISNPPFYLAIDFIRKALQDVKDGGLVIMLLRLNFLGSQERLPFWKDNMANAAFVHSKRMKFIAGKSGDSCEYAHFVWQKGNQTDFCKLKVI